MRPGTWRSSRRREKKTSSTPPIPRPQRNVLIADHGRPQKQQRTRPQARWPMVESSAWCASRPAASGGGRRCRNYSRCRRPTNLKNLVRYLLGATVLGVQTSLGSPAICYYTMRQGPPNPVIRGQVALLNSAWAGIWLCLGILATFVGRHSLLSPLTIPLTPPLWHAHRVLRIPNRPPA